MLIQIQSGMCILLNTLCVLTKCNINKFQTGYFMFKVNNILLPSNSIGMFLKNTNIHDHNTSNKLVFHVIPHSLTVHEYSIKIDGVKLWNN